MQPAVTIVLAQYVASPDGPEFPDLIMALGDDGVEYWVTMDARWRPWKDFLANGGIIQPKPEVPE